MSFAGLLPGDRKYLSGLQKKRKKKDKLKTPDPPAKPDKKDKKEDKPKRWKKGEAAYHLGTATKKLGKRLTKASDSEAEKTFNLKDKLHAERKKMHGKKRK